MPRSFDMVSANDRKNVVINLKKRTFRINVLKFYSIFIEKLIAHKTMPCAELMTARTVIRWLHDYLNNDTCGSN